jgi:hypothetical protein
LVLAPRGTRESDAVRGHREVTLLLRAEVTALTGLLLRKGVISQEEFEKALAEEAVQLAEDLAKRYPGIRCNDEGLTLNTAQALETMRKMGFRP